MQQRSRTGWIGGQKWEVIFTRALSIDIFRLARATAGQVCLLFFVFGCNHAAVRAGADADKVESYPAGMDDGPVEKSAAAGGEEDPLWPPIRDDAVGRWAWHEQAHYAINGRYLLDFFEKTGYTPPAGSEIVAARVVEGIGQPAYRFYDMQGSAFSFDFWPASTIKLLAALGALDFLRTRKMSGKATAAMYYPDGNVLTKKVRSIYSHAIGVSSNPDYDRCVEIAGFDRLNKIFLSPENDLPTTVIQRRYSSKDSLRTSPPMQLAEGGRKVKVPERVGKGEFSCPDEGNCANLFELINALRRVVLHDEIPPAERFNLGSVDVEGLRKALAQAESKFLEGAVSVFGAGLLIYNKTGFVPGDDILDHGLVVDLATGDRYLVAVSVPHKTSSRGELSDFVEQALLALFVADPAEQMPWQYDAGIQIRVQLDDGGVEDGRRRIHFTVDAAGADTLRLWTDTWLLGEAVGGPRFSFSHEYACGGKRLLVIQAYSDGTPVGYRGMPVFIPEP